MCHRLLITLIALMFSATGISAQEPEKEGYTFTKWVQERQVYPRKALKACLQGRVTIQFNILPSCDLAVA